MKQPLKIGELNCMRKSGHWVMMTGCCFPRTFWPVGNCKGPPTAGRSHLILPDRSRERPYCSLLTKEYWYTTLCMKSEGGGDFGSVFVKSSFATS